MVLPTMQCMTNVFSFVINVNEGCLKISFVVEACPSFYFFRDKNWLINKNHLYIVRPEGREFLDMFSVYYRMIPIKNQVTLCMPS